MAVGPRIVFVRFQNADSPKLTPWISHVSRVVGRTARAVVPVVGDSRVVWQLVSANNRELARSVDVYGTFEAATAGAQHVVDSSSTSVIEQVSEAGRGVYGWFVTVDGVPVMTCARWYVTDRDRRHSIEIARRAVVSATLHTGARLNLPALMGGDLGRQR
jgi:hypothetical protein